MKILNILFLAFAVSFPGYSQARTAHGPNVPILPTANIAGNLPIEVYVTELKLSGQMKKLTVKVQLINRSRESIDFSLGGLSLTVVNSKTKKKEQWVSHQITAENRAYQRQPGSGAIVVPAKTSAYAEITFNSYVGKYAQEIIEGSMSVNISGADRVLTVPQLKRPQDGFSDGSKPGPKRPVSGPNNGPSGAATSAPNSGNTNTGSGGVRPGARPGN